MSRHLRIDRAINLLAQQDTMEFVSRTANTAAG